MKICEIKAKSIFVKSNLPDADYVANPYTGCIFGCAYCYATFMSRSVNESSEDWGKYVYVKTNAAELAAQELKRWRKNRLNSTVFLSSVTDPYQGIERKYRLTRGILEALAEIRYPGRTGILTKGPLVLRDIDLFKRLPNVEVGLTITTVDDPAGRLLEVHAPPSERRLEVLKELHDQGIETYAFVGPLFPHLAYFPEKLEKLFEGLARAGADSLYVEQINLKPYIRERLLAFLREKNPGLAGVYEQAAERKFRAELDRIARKLIARYGMRLRCDEVIEHNEEVS